MAPPLIVNFSFLGAGLYVESLLPSPKLAWPPIYGIGLLLLTVGITGVFLSIRAMREAQTAVDPYKPATAIVTKGPYRYSRNPIYVADTIIYLGIALIFDVLWAISFMPILIWFMQVGVITREERYLEHKFAETYLEYKKSVRRWF